MPHRRDIPKPAARRLSLYLRELSSRLEQGEETVNSKALGLSLGLTDAQVRKDLAIFGQLGHPGRGYRVADLIASLRRIMGRDRAWTACVVGAGNIGRALVSYDRFRKEGFSIVAVFDGGAAMVGREVGDLKVRPMSDLAKAVAVEGIELGIIAVPRDSAQQVADALVAAGIKGILNFAPRRIVVRDGISIVSVDFTVALEQLAFQVAGASEPEDVDADPEDTTHG
ncbi:MAG: redox-sensing transcriptional repressor Rex [Planctomycetaceae bacterium]|nr:redox-sensing transcriptional repressor Rex [Planctomycetaceae bacterium]